MAAEGPEDSGSYVLHHLTNLQLDLRTMSLVSDSKAFWVLNIDSVVFSIVLAILLFAFFMRVAKKANSGVPSGFENFIELCVEFVQGQVREIYPHANSLVAPLGLTILMWVLAMNVMDILPVDWLPYVGEHVFGLSHLRIVPSTDVNITFGLSISIFVLMYVFSFVYKGPIGLGKEFLTHPFFIKFGPSLQKNALLLIPNILFMFVNVVLRLVEDIAKPVSLALRLFGNLFAGELIFVLIAVFSSNAFDHGIGGAIAFGLGGALIQLAWAIFHLLVIPLQAFVFMILTVVYLASASQSHSEEH